MRFGKSTQENREDPGRGGGGGDFIRYLRDGDNQLRILQEVDEWTWFWEHYNPLSQASFPCPRDVSRDPVEMCPGCSSENDRMKRASHRAAFNVLHSFNGVEYVDAYKVPVTVAQKLENRAERIGTITDRDYIIRRYKGAGDRYDFDVEGTTPAPVDLRKSEWKDIEELLQTAWTDSWGEGPQARANQQATRDGETERAVTSKVRATIAPKEVQPEEPPFEPPEEREYQEDYLRGLPREELVLLVKNEMGAEVPGALGTSDEIVDWLIAHQS